MNNAGDCRSDPSIGLAVIATDPGLYLALGQNLWCLFGDGCHPVDLSFSKTT